MNTLRSLTCYILLFAFTQFAVAQTPPEQNTGSPASAPDNSSAIPPKHHPLSAIGKRNFKMALWRQTSARICGGSARARIMSARLTTRTTPSGFWRRFKEWGLDAHIETFDVLFPTPKERSLELVAPTHFTRQTAGTGAGRRSHFQPDCRATAHL